MEDNEIKDIRSICTRTGGFMSHLGTADAQEVTKRAAQGDKEAARVWNAMIYQIIKYIGSMSTALKGHVDGILLGGGMVRSEDLVRQITDSCSWIATVSAYPGEFEMEAMAAGAIRVLRGEEEAKEYTGIPIWNGFDDCRVRV
jgi:butyrate kinase